MRSLRGQRLLALLLALAVGLLQALGAARGYVCDCADGMRLVASPRCGDGCHPGGAHHHHAPAGHAHPPDADGGHDHHELRGTVDAAGTLKAASAEFSLPDGATPPPPGVLPSCRPAPRAAPSGLDSGPPPPLLVARTVVRQV